MEHALWQAVWDRLDIAANELDAAVTLIWDQRLPCVGGMRAVLAAEVGEMVVALGDLEAVIAAIDAMAAKDGGAQ